MGILLALVLAAQDPARLVEKFQSERVEDREEAERSLRELGPAALPALRAAARGDAETRARAERLVRLIEIDAQLPRRIRKIRPRLSEDLADGTTTWAEAFLELSHPERHPSPRPNELEALVPRAFAEPLSPDEKLALCEAAWKGQVRASIPKLVAWLGEPQVRRVAVRALSILGAREAAPAIAELLVEKDSDLLVEALQTLAALRVAETAPRIVPVLRDDRIWIRLAAITALGAIGAEEAAEPLAALLGAEDSSTGQRAAAVLADLRSRKAVPALLRVLEGPKPEPRTMAVKLLGALGEVGAVERMLTDPDRQVRTAAGEAIPRPVPPGTFGIVVGLLSHELADVREEAARLLQRFGDPAAVPPLERRLTVEPRPAIVSALAALGSRESWPRLAALLEDSKLEVRRSVVEAIGQLRMEDQVPRLVALLRDPDLRSAALQTLVRLGAKEAAREIVPYLPDHGALAALLELDPHGCAAAIIECVKPRLKDPDEGVRIQALYVLGTLGARGVESEVLPLLGSEHRRVREAAGEAALALELPGAVGRLRALLRHENPEIRGGAVEGLGGWGTAEAVEALIGALKDMDSNVRWSALYALDKLRPASAVPAVTVLLRDESESVRGSAVRFLADVQGRTAIPALLPLIADPSLEVRNAAAEALDALDAREAAVPFLDLIANPESNGHGQAPYLAAKEALIRWKEKGVVEGLRALLCSRKHWVAALAAEILADLGEPQVIPDLKTLAIDGHSQSRHAAVEALQRLGADEVLLALEPELEEEIPWIRGVAVEIRARRGDSKAVLRLLADPDGSNRVQACDLAAEGKLKEAIPAVRALLKDPASSVRAAAARAVVELGMREAAGDLVPLLEDRETASAALHGLERLGTAAQADALVLYLESPRAEMHRLALEALWKVKPEAGVAALPGLMARGLLSAGYLPDAAQAHLRTAAGMRRLVEVKGRPPRVLLELCDSLGSAEASRELLFLLKDRNPGLRREALRVFARLGTFPSGGEFLECLKDPASSVRCEAASALCRMGRREGVAVLLAEAERWTGVDLNVLNALRRPEEWKKLESARLKEQVSGPIRTLVPKLVEQAGFRLVWPKETVVREWRSHEGWAGPGRRIVDALLDFLHGSPCEMVLEAGEVRLIPSHEAPAFWRGALK